MTPTVTHNAAVTQVVTPATVVLTVSTQAAKALAALLAVVREDELLANDLPTGLIRQLDPSRMLVVNNSYGEPTHIALKFLNRS